MTEHGKRADCSRDPVVVKAAKRLVRRAGHKVNGKVLRSDHRRKLLGRGAARRLWPKRKIRRIRKKNKKIRQTCSRDLNLPNACAESGDPKYCVKGIGCIVAHYRNNNMNQGFSKMVYSTGKPEERPLMSLGYGQFPDPYIFPSK